MATISADLQSADPSSARPRHQRDTIDKLGFLNSFRRGEPRWIKQLVQDDSHWCAVRVWDVRPLQPILQPNLHPFVSNPGPGQDRDSLKRPQDAALDGSLMRMTIRIASPYHRCSRYYFRALLPVGKTPTPHARTSPLSSVG